MGSTGMMAVYKCILCKSYDINSCVICECFLVFLFLTIQLNKANWYIYVHDMNFLDVWMQCCYPCYHHHYYHYWKNPTFFCQILFIFFLFLNHVSITITEPFISSFPNPCVSQTVVLLLQNCWCSDELSDLQRKGFHDFRVWLRWPIHLLDSL